jgi:hypothetical protein
MSIARESDENTTSPTTQLSDFYLFCRDNEIEKVQECLKTMTLESINRKEPNGSTALHVAAYRGNDEIVKALLKRGAIRSIKNNYGFTPFEKAATSTTAKLFDRVYTTSAENRFTNTTRMTMEWIEAGPDVIEKAAKHRNNLKFIVFQEIFQKILTQSKANLVAKRIESFAEKYLTNKEQLEQINVLLNDAFKEDSFELCDWKSLVKAYTAETDFYKVLNTNLARLQKKHFEILECLDKLSSLGSINLFPMVSTCPEHALAAIFIEFASGQAKDHNYLGTTYRGMQASEDELSKYTIGNAIMNRTFMSTSIDKGTAANYSYMNIDLPLRPRANNDGFVKTPVICSITIRNAGTALDIQSISEYSTEQEVLIVPYCCFRVIKMERDIIENVSPVVYLDLEECDIPELPKRQRVDDENDDD